MRKLERELKREFPDTEIEVTSGGHYRLRLPNGGFVVVASTPSCRRYLRNARRDVRRQLQLNPEPHHEKV
jgi:hypothetical protein